MTRRIWLSAFLAAGVVGGAFAAPEPAAKQPGLYTFGSLKAPTPEAARAAAKTWYDSTGKADSAAFAAIWDAADKPLLDRVTETLALANPEVGKVLAEARDPAAPAPKQVPAPIKDAKQSVYFRSNLALAYAKALAGKRVYEEALEALRAATPEQVVDPAAYYFHKAVAEHAMIQKREAANSIARLLDDVGDAPDRYKMVATLMFFDMQSWKDDDKDLGQIAKLMDNIERRLDQSRGGPKTQELQKKVVFRLDELIKDVENQMKNNGQPVACPGGEPKGPGPATNQPSMPQQDSQIQTNSGPGLVDPKKLQHLAQNWGKLPEKERAKAMMEITKDLPPRYREVIENYFKTLAKSQEK